MSMSTYTPLSRSQEPSSKAHLANAFPHVAVKAEALISDFAMPGAIDK